MIRIKCCLLSFILLLLIGIAPAQSPSWKWANTAIGGNDLARGVTNDFSGNTIVTGSFSDSTITFGNITLTNTLPGNADIFIVKYDPSGNVLWAYSFGGSLSDVGITITTDTFGNIFLTGAFDSPSITFGSTTLVNNTVGGFVYDSYLVKCDTNGTVLWAKSPIDPNSDIGTSLTIDGTGNIIVCGQFEGTILFDSFTLSNFSVNNIYDVYTVKYDPNGNILWAKSEGGNDVDAATEIKTDTSGNIYLSGYFYSPTISIGNYTLTNSGITDIFNIKYDPSGNVLWANSIGSTDMDIARSEPTPNGELYIAGSFYGSTLSLNSIVLTNNSAGTPDLFIAKYDTAGTLIWAKSYGGNSSDFASNTVLDSYGNITAMGEFTSPTITFGTASLTNAGSYDMFITKFDSSGTVLWAKSAGDSNEDYVNSISIDMWDNIFICGYFNSPQITFGTNTLTQSGTSSIFVSKLSEITGVKSNNNNTTFSVAPNPVTNQTMLQFSNMQFNTTIRIVDILGHEIKKINFSGYQIALNIDLLKPGIYFAQFFDENKKMNAVKLLVK